MLQRGRRAIRWPHGADAMRYTFVCGGGSRWECHTGTAAKQPSLAHDTGCIVGGSSSGPGSSQSGRAKYEAVTGDVSLRRRGLGYWMDHNCPGLGAPLDTEIKPHLVNSGNLSSRPTHLPRLRDRRATSARDFVASLTTTPKRWGLRRADQAKIRPLFGAA